MMNRRGFLGLMGSGLISGGAVSPAFGQTTSRFYQDYLVSSSVFDEFEYPKGNAYIITPREMVTNVNVIIFCHNNLYDVSEYRELMRHWMYYGNIVIAPRFDSIVSTTAKDSEEFGNDGMDKEIIFERARYVSRVINLIPEILYTLNKKGNNLFVAGHGMGASTAMNICGINNYFDEQAYTSVDKRVNGGIFLSPPMPGKMGIYDLNTDIPFIIQTKKDLWDSAFASKPETGKNFLIKTPKIAPLTLTSAMSTPGNVHQGIVNDVKVATTAFIDTVGQREEALKYLQSPSLFRDSFGRTSIYFR